jgi:hypothetical protein
MIFQPNTMHEQKEVLDYLSLTIAAEISLACATLLAFFVHLRLPLNYATGASLLALLLGSALIWSNIVMAEAFLLVCVLAIELILYSYFPILIWAFAVLDLVLIGWLASLWNLAEKIR